MSEDIAGESLAVKPYFAAKFVFGAKRASFCEDVACAEGIGLNFHKRAVFAENGERLKKDWKVGTGGPRGEVVDHKVRAEKVGPIAAGSIALRGAGQIELCCLEKVMFDFEPRVERVLCVFPNKSAEEVRSHAGVQILTDLERDLDFFRERRRDVLGYLILFRIATPVRRKISDARARTTFDLNARS